MNISKESSVMKFTDRNFEEMNQILYQSGEFDAENTIQLKQARRARRGNTAYNNSYMAGKRHYESRILRANRRS